MYIYSHIGFSIRINLHHARSLLEDCIYSLPCVIQKWAPDHLASLIIHPRGNSIGTKIREMQSRHTLDMSFYKCITLGLKFNYKVKEWSKSPLISWNFKWLCLYISIRVCMKNSDSRLHSSPCLCGLKLYPRHSCALISYYGAICHWNIQCLPSITVFKVWIKSWLWVNCIMGVDVFIL